MRAGSGTPGLEAERSPDGLRAPGLERPVEVLYDRWGVPAVTAASLDDLWFAQGFLSASERLFQIDLALRASSGRLSELFANITLQEDAFARTVGLHRAGARYVSGWDADSRAMVQRFVEGVHAWISRLSAPPLEYTVLDASPDLPRDLEAWASCWAFLAWNLSGNWDVELLRVRLSEELGPEMAAILLPPSPSIDPAITAGGLTGTLLRDAPLRERGLGSNSWVVAGSRTASGRPLLANDPHLSVQQPAAWLEFHLSAPGYRARGVALPFFPAIAIGATTHHAWGATNVTGDVQDLFLERLNDDRTAALFQGTWEQLTVHREEIRVRGAAAPHVVEVLESRHGPILETYSVGVSRVEYRPLAETYALRWAGHDVGVRPRIFLDAARARSFQEFREAARDLGCPGQNFVYADVSGTIGYQLTGLYPVRRAGDGTVPVPGWTGEHEWTGWIPFDELPWSMDPARGYLVTANNQTFDDSYPHLIGRDFHAPYRALRIAQMIEARDDHDVDSTRAIQMDTVGLHVHEIIRRLPKDAAQVFAGWDGDLRSDSVPATLFGLFVLELARQIVPDPELLDRYIAWREPFVCWALPRLLDLGTLQGSAVTEAIHRAIERDPAPWGELHRVQFAHPLGTIPGLEALFVAAQHPLGGDEQTVNQGGFEGRGGAFEPAVVPSWRAAYDLADLDRSVGVLTTGQSGNPASPHWNDQTHLWVDGGHKPLPITRRAVEAAAVSAVTLLPG